jgi:hypothetical protein
MLKVSRYEAVEVSIPSGSTLSKFFFPDLPNLTGRDGYPVSINSIVFFSSDATTLSPLSGSSLVTQTDMQKSYLTIYQGDLQVLYNIPVVSLNFVRAASTSTQPYVNDQPELMNLKNVSWTKSFISLSTPPGTTNRVYSIGVYYTVNY